MTKNTKFDLKDFQSDVFKRYTSLLREINDAALFSEKGYKGLIKDSDYGFIRRKIKKLLIALKVKFHKFYVKSKAFIELERKAEEIIDNPKIIKILCPVFKRRIAPDFFKEELEIEVIIIITTALTKTNIAEEFSIESDVLLFSIITHLDFVHFRLQSRAFLSGFP